MRGLGLVGCLTLAGCNSLVGADEFEIAKCFGHLVEVCLPAPPTGDVSLTSTQPLDTGRDARCVVVPQPNGPELCVIAGQTVTVGMLQAVGRRPLVLIGADTITVTGTLDVSPSFMFGQNGAGSDSDLCTTTGIDGAAGTTGGGGAGGSFGTKGGDGAPAIDSTAGGVAVEPVAKLDAIRGGCSGGDGGSSSNDGSSGGAVYLVAGNTISVMGEIYAVGIGGFGGDYTGTNNGGGGGGGSGGMIALDARTVDVLGTLSANGGGGGGGADVADGRDGQSGQRMRFSDVATGGTGPAAGRGGVGGNGAAAMTAATAGMTATASGGGGGGGGGAGVIWIHGDVTGSKMSPSPTTD